MHIKGNTLNGMVFGKSLFQLLDPNHKARNLQGNGEQYD
jgi:hypothetical protein